MSDTPSNSGGGNGAFSGDGHGGNGGDVTSVPPGYGFAGLDYPCRFEIKAMGARSTKFVALVQRIIGRHIEASDLLATSSRESRAGRYLSVTCVIQASSAEQLTAIYRDLSQCREVLMTL